MVDTYVLVDGELISILHPEAHWKAAYKFFNQRYPHLNLLPCEDHWELWDLSKRPYAVILFKRGKLYWYDGEEIYGILY